MALDKETISQVRNEQRSQKVRICSSLMPDCHVYWFMGICATASSGPFLFSLSPQFNHCGSKSSSRKTEKNTTTHGVSFSSVLLCFLWSNLSGFKLAQGKTNKLNRGKICFLKKDALLVFGIMRPYWAISHFPSKILHLFGVYGGGVLHSVHTSRDKGTTYRSLWVQRINPTWWWLPFHVSQSLCQSARYPYEQT